MMSRSRGQPNAVDFSQHLRADMIEAIHVAVEAEGFAVVPGGQPSIGYKSLLTIETTLTILHEAERAVPLTVLAAALVKGTVAAIKKWKHRPSIEVIIHGPKGEELTRVEVPAPDREEK
jgi:dihydroxyacetone kinase DhaKLM complex PTS-EIIA-like component DhaM